MPYADPERAAAVTREWWARNGRAYRASRGADPTPPPLSRGQALAEDIAQERELARLEARRIGWTRATARLEAFIRRERSWIAATATRYRVEGGNAVDEA